MTSIRPWLACGTAGLAALLLSAAHPVPAGAQQPSTTASQAASPAVSPDAALPQARAPLEVPIGVKINDEQTPNIVAELNSVLGSFYVV